MGEQYPKFKGNAHEKEQEVSYRFTQEFLQSYQVSDHLYNETLNVIGSEQGMVEFICVIGHYVGLVAQLNILRVPNPGDKQIFQPSIKRYEKNYYRDTLKIFFRKLC